MKRKVNRVGQSTLTVSLPSSWVKKFHVKQGDEIDLVEDGDTLHISVSLKKDARKEITIDISHLGPMIGRTLGALYKAGFDRIKVLYDNEELRKVVEDEVNKSFISMDVIDHGIGYCIIEEMGSINKDELDKSIKRIFFLLLTNLEESIEAIKKRDYEILQQLYDKDRIITKFADVARRLTNKFNITDDMNMIYYISEELENIGDNYKELFKIIIEFKLKASREVIDYYAKSVEMLRIFYELFYNYSDAKLVKFRTQFVSLMKLFYKKLPSLNASDAMIMSKTNDLIDKIFQMYGPLIMSYYLKSRKKI